MMAETARVLVQRQRLRRCDGRLEELAKTMEASPEEDGPEYSTTTMEVSAEEAE